MRIGFIGLGNAGESRIWLEMSTTDESEVRRIGALVDEAGVEPVDCPVSGGCHREHSHLFWV
jgi:3-hydroxyisobutyrate dehydrogenase